MLSIDEEKFIKFESDVSVVRVKMFADTVEELPDIDGLTGKKLAIGSECCITGTGDKYVMSSVGDWVKLNFNGGGEGGGDGSAYAHSLELAIDQQTYVLAATLKNSDGQQLATAQTIDLPLESMVVGGSYDSTNKKVILTLKNGQTVDFSVADLISGLQSEITSNNKLNADLVDDTNSTHKFVTSAEKTQITTNANNITLLQQVIGDINSVLEEVL